MTLRHINNWVCKYHSFIYFKCIDNNNNEYIKYILKIKY